MPQILMHIDESEALIQVAIFSMSFSAAWIDDEEVLLHKKKRKNTAVIVINTAYTVYRTKIGKGSFLVAV